MTGPRVLRMLGQRCALFLVLCWSNSLTALAACPFCPPSSPPLAEQVATSDVGILVKWARSIPNPQDATEIETEFQVVETFRQTDPARKVASPLRVPYLLEAKPGDLFVMLGNHREELIDWQLPIEVSEVSYGYLRQLPPLEKPPGERLPFFLKFLQYSDPLLANDAFAEFSRARYEDVVAIRERLSRETVRRWMRELAPTEQMRLGFYALLLGMCGNAADADYLAGEVLRPTPGDTVRLGLDGMMAGYVLLTGEAGLNRLIAAQLDTPDQPDGDVYAFVNTLRFLWQYAPDRAPREQVAAAMARLVDRPAFAEVAIVDLARWGHWDMTERILAQYGQPPFDDPAAKRQLIHFALACVKAHERSAEASPAHVAAAQLSRKFLDRLSQTDPDTLQNARRFFTGSREPTN